MPVPRTFPPLPFLLALLAGCGSFDVHSTHDKDFDFSKAQTYDWLPAPSQADGGVNDAGVLGVISAEIEAKGLKKATTGRPDLLVAVHRTIVGLQDSRKWGYDLSNGRVERYPMGEGTLVLDMLSASTRQNVWRGTATGAFRFEQSEQERRDMVAKIVREMLEDFPPKR
jgi:hypothetical protein